MVSYIKSNPLIMIFIVSLVVLVLLYFYLKTLSVKTKKKEEKIKEDKQDDSNKTVEISTEEQVEKKDEPKEEQEEIESVVGRGGKKSRVTRIYRRDLPKPAINEEISKDEKLADLDAEFVDVSKNVSKFKTLKEEDFSDNKVESKVDEFGFVSDTKEDCDFCKDKVKHFDHSRRLSKFIKEDNFDDMFASHLSSYTDRIEDIDKHLNISDESLNKLYDKASKTIDNSKRKIVSDVIKESINDSIEEHNENVVSNEELQTKIDLKTMLIADTIMNRKKKK